MPEGGKTAHARNPSWDPLRKLPQPDESKPDNLPRLSRSMPSLGAMMHPEIGLAGSLAGEGKFRRQFEQVKRESSNSGSWPSAEGYRDSALRREFSGQLEGRRSLLAETSLESARNSFDEAIDDMPLTGGAGAAAVARDRAAAAGDASRAQAPAAEPSARRSPGPGTDASVSPPNRRKFVINAASADGADARRKANVKGRFVIKERQEQASLWGFGGQAPADPRQGTLVSRAPRKASRKFEVTGASPSTSRSPSAAAGATQPQCGAGGGGRQGSPHCWAASERGAVPGAPAAPVGVRRQGAPGAHNNDRRAGTSRLDKLPDVPDESGLALVCNGARANRALFTSWADPGGGADGAGGRASPVAAPPPIEMMVALLEAQRDLLAVENAALQQLNASLERHAVAQRAVGTGPRVVSGGNIL